MKKMDAAIVGAVATAVWGTVLTGLKIAAGASPASLLGRYGSPSARENYRRCQEHRKAKIGSPLTHDYLREVATGNYDRINQIADSDHQVPKRFSGAVLDSIDVSRGA